MQSHPTQVVPWHTVATDLFKTKNSKYLLIVDYYSRFPILRELSSTTSRVLIQEMKAVFTELGVPSVIVSDGVPQYTATEFQDFTKHWQIKHRLSSSRNLQSNGMVKCFVQTMKASLIKTIEEGEGDLALLTYKTMPLNHRLPSPVELLNSRKNKTLVPTCIVPTRLQETYRQIMDEVNKYRHNNITGVAECYQDSNSLKKLWCNWIQTRMYGLKHKLYNAQLGRADHIVSRLYSGESIPGTGDS